MASSSISEPAGILPALPSQRGLSNEEIVRDCIEKSRALLTIVLRDRELSRDLETQCTLTLADDLLENAMEVQWGSS